MELEESALPALNTFTNLIDIFAIVLYKHDPISLNSPDPTEYESESLSILARFVESGIHLVDDDVAVPAAIEIVKNALIFWFEEDSALSARAKSVDYAPVSKELVAVFKAELADEIEDIENVSLAEAEAQAEFAKAAGLDVEFPRSERTVPGTPHAIEADSVDLDGPAIVVTERK